MSRVLTGLCVVAAFIATLRIVTAGGLLVQSSDTSFRVSVNLVQLDAVVTDSKGQHVIGLKPDDFELFEDGRPQKISNFSWIDVAAPKPVRLAGNLPAPPAGRRDFHRSFILMIDDSGAYAERDVLPVIDAAKKLVVEQVQHTDLVAVTASRGGMGFYQQFTNDKRQLEAAIEKIASRPGFGRWTADPPEQRDPDTGLWVPITLKPGEPGYSYRGGSEPNPVGRLVWAIQNLRDAPGRKAIILLSHSFNAPPSVIELANRAGVVIYVIDPHGESLTFQPRPMVLPDGRKAIDLNVKSPIITSREPYRLLAKQTGGLWIKSAPGSALVADMGKALSDMNDYYLIGYQPAHSDFEVAGGKPLHHEILLKPKRAGLTVRTRSGFMGIPDAERPRLGTIDGELQAALFSPIREGALDVRLDSTYAASEPDPKTALRSPVVRTLLTVDESGLRIPGSAEVEDFDVLLAVFNEDGTPAAQGRRAFHLEITPENATQIIENGLGVAMDVKLAHPGNYQVRAAIREANSGATGSSYTFVALPDYNRPQLVLSSIQLTPAGRIFPGQKVPFECQILGVRTHASQIEMQVRLFREGDSHPVYDSGAQAVATQALARNRLTGELNIGAEIEPGKYAMQLIAYERLSTHSRQIAIQWTRVPVIKTVAPGH